MIQQSLGKQVVMIPETLKIEEVFSDGNDGLGLPGSAAVIKMSSNSNFNQIEIDFLSNLFEGHSLQLINDDVTKLMTDYVFKVFDVSFKTKNGNTIIIDNVSFLRPTVVYSTDEEGVVNGKFCMSGTISKETRNLYGNDLVPNGYETREWAQGIRTYLFRNKDTGIYLRTSDRKHLIIMQGALLFEGMPTPDLN